MQRIDNQSCSKVNRLEQHRCWATTNVNDPRACYIKRVANLLQTHVASVNVMLLILIEGIAAIPPVIRLKCVIIHVIASNSP
jgi:hypothetical protein